jgi:hypothetical protein
MEHHQLDLHGIRHCDVDRKVENFILLNQTSTPLIIICGNSQRMIDIVNHTVNRLCIQEYTMNRYGVISIYKV